MADSTLDYEPLDGNLHRHAGGVTHAHPHDGPHKHAARNRSHDDDFGSGPRQHHDHRRDHPRRYGRGQRHDGRAHSHGLIDESITRSREGVRVVSLSLVVLMLTTAAQVVIFIATNSVALLADLIHNFGDALTAVPLGAAFVLRSRIAERWAGYFVVATIFVSACVAAVEAVNRLIHPQALSHLFVLALAGAIGFIGNEIAAVVRLRGGKRLKSAALIADGNHARIDGFVSLAVVASAIVVALGVRVADPVIGLVITIVILRITWQSFQTIKADARHNR